VKQDLVRKEASASTSASSTSLSSSTSTSSPTQAFVPDTASFVSSTSDFPTAVKIAVLVCSVILGVALFAALVYFLHRRRKRSISHNFGTEEKILPISEPYQSAMEHPLALEEQDHVLPQRKTKPSELEGRTVYPREMEEDDLGEMRVIKGTRRTRRDFLPSEHWTFLRDSSATDNLE
jgi:hypothetical protein